MRLSPSFAIAALATTVAHATSNVIASRQFGAGLSVDVCGNLDFVLKVPNLLLPGKFITIGNIKECICKSELHNFCATNVLAIAATAIVGRLQVEQIISEKFSSADCKTCSYPGGSSPQCKKDNPCFFDCKDGFIPFPFGNPTSCACKNPHNECNGKCGSYPSCPSQSLGKRDSNALWARDKMCSHGLTACGVFGGRARSWECVDTQSDLESCGGCSVPLYFGAPGRTGEDCSALPGVRDVSCVRGGCMVHRCEPGYFPNADRTACVYDENNDPALLAAEYGLEHTNWSKY